MKFTNVFYECSAMQWEWIAHTFLERKKLLFSRIMVGKMNPQQHKNAF